MAADCQHATSLSRVRPISPRRATVAGGKRALYLVLLNLVAISTCILIAELGFRLFWNPRYWVHTSRWDVGSGQTRAGKKWWPDTRYLVESSEFQVEFRTDDRGYRARLGPVQAAHPLRVAFVGDSFTEGMQVANDSTFLARLEHLLTGTDASRPIICENDGVSATDLFDYWHRIVHDVLSGEPPDALILCIYPGNDFQGLIPDDAFGADGHPTREFFKAASWSQHVIAWINLHSKFGSYVQRALLSVGGKPAPSQSEAPRNWWANPEIAARAAGVPAVRQSRALLQAIDEECRRHGTRLCVLVVGPVHNYTARDGDSPIGRIVGNWGLDIPVIDVAIKARARADYRTLTFPIDGHLNETGHAYVAREAAPALQAVLASAGKTASR